MVYMFLAHGFEEIEATVPLDLLRRAGVEVKTVGVGGAEIKGAHDIAYRCDTVIEEIQWDNPDMIILPGGMPGTKNLAQSKKVREFITACAENNGYIAAICAAPSILGEMNVLKDKRVTCYPGYEDMLTDAKIVDAAVCRDGNIITARAAGAAFDFARVIITELKGEKVCKKVFDSIYCD